MGKHFEMFVKQKTGIIKVLLMQREETVQRKDGWKRPSLFTAILGLVGFQSKSHYTLRRITLFISWLPLYQIIPKMLSEYHKSDYSAYLGEAK